MERIPGNLLFCWGLIKSTTVSYGGLRKRQGELFLKLAWVCKRRPELPTYRLERFGLPGYNVRQDHESIVNKAKPNLQR